MSMTPERRAKIEAAGFQVFDDPDEMFDAMEREAGERDSPSPPDGQLGGHATGEPSDDTPATPSPFDGLIPPIMAPAWLGSLQFALGNPEMLAAFRAETGNTWEPAGTPIELMIDDACGAPYAFFRAFAKWHNANVWGEIDGRPMDVGDPMEDDDE